MDKMTKFPKISKKEWLDKVKKDLKGKPLDSLNWELSETLRISPFKDETDLTQQTYSPRPNANNYWSVSEPIKVSDKLKEANELILDTLQKGSSGLSLYFEGVPTIDGLTILLTGVFINLIPIEFIVLEKSDFEATIRVVQEFFKNSSFDNDQIDCYFTTKNITDNKKTYPSVSLIRSFCNTISKAKIITINGGDFFNGSAEVEEELGSILHTTQQLLDHYQELGFDLDVLAKAISFNLILGDTYYINISKLRALRNILALLYQSYNIERGVEPNIKISIAPSPNSGDPNYHRIRTAAIALSGVIGGVTRLELYDIDNQNAEENIEFQRRIARNVSHLMQLESYMDRVTDPAAGSYYLESLTEEIAENSWINFQNKWSKTQS